MKLPESLLSVSIWLFAVGVACSAAPDTIVIDSALLQLIEQVDVPARVSAVLSSMNVAEGDVISAGAKVAQLDDKEMKLNLERAAIELELSSEKANNQVAIRSAQRSLEHARTEHERLQRTASGLPGSVSQSALDEVKLKLDQSQLDLEQAQHDLRLSQLTAKLKKQELALGKHQIAQREIVAPVNGVVVEVVRHAGEWVQPGDKVIRMVRIDRLRAEGLIHVRHVTDDLKGSPATVTVEIPERPEVQVPGQVVFVSPEVNPVNGLVRISVEFTNPNNLLRPGLRGQIAIPAAGLKKSSVSASPGKLPTR
jgi:macrolide-specific efflux system membrane fusion protein